MEINKKFIHAKTLAEFQKELSAGNILDESIVFIKDAQQIWTHGQYYSITDAPADGNIYARKDGAWEKFTPGESITDLSMVDIYGNERTSATTANCYVIKKPGTYRIPLVYGNAIVNGSTNSASYTKVSETHSLDFVNGAGTIINTPFIEKQTVIINTQLSIADTNSVFTGISVNSNPNVTDISDCGYVQFKVTSVPSTGANGIISIMNSSGTIVWNWHIWIWADNLSTVSIKNGSGVTYNILPYNLASKWDSSEKTSIKNWYYQWGRNVPMLCPSAYNSQTDSNSYGTLEFNTKNRANRYSQGIANPTTFYYNSSSPCNWFSSTSYYNLWDANCTKSGASDNITIKTVYDPCPPGFKIPNGNTFTGFSKSNGGSFNNGYTWNGTFFPASGSRVYLEGYLDDVGSLGSVFTSAVSKYDQACSLEFSSDDVSPQMYTFCAQGSSVRPVAES